MMKKNLSLLPTLALAATLSPAVFAQQDQNPQPGATEPQTQSAPAPDASADAHSPNDPGDGEETTLAVRRAHDGSARI